MKIIYGDRVVLMQAVRGTAECLVHMTVSVAYRQNAHLDIIETLHKTSASQK